MPTPVYSETLGGLMRLLLRRQGMLLGDGTADSGTATTLVHNQLVDTTANRITGAWVYIFAGTAIGRIARASNFTASSDTVTLIPTGTAIDSTSQYGIWRGPHPREIESAFLQAQRMIGSVGAFRRYGRAVALERVDRSFILGNPLANAGFYIWTNGASSAPDGWTLAGAGSTIAREATRVKAGRYSAAVTNALNTATTFDQSVDLIGAYAGATLSGKAWVFASFTSPAVTLELSDGVSTDASRTHGGGGWEYLETPNLVIAKNATRLRLRLAIASGTSRTTYLNAPWIPGTYQFFGNEYLVDADNNWIVVNGDLHLSGLVSGDPGSANLFGRTVPPQAWDVVYETPRKLRLNLSGGLEGRLLSVTGWQRHAELTATGTSWTGHPEALVPLALAILERNALESAENRFKAQGDIEAMARRIVMEHGVSAPYAKIIEPN